MIDTAARLSGTQAANVVTASAAHASLPHGNREVGMELGAYALQDAKRIADRIATLPPCIARMA
ncbi:MAG TPA: hypothetical protein VIH96_23590, partial [Paraburkholderia sp.]